MGGGEAELRVGGVLGLATSACLARPRRHAGARRTLLTNASLLVLSGLLYGIACRTLCMVCGVCSVSILVTSSSQIFKQKATTLPSHSLLSSATEFRCCCIVFSSPRRT